jgi:hypothetical protein
MAFQDGRPAMKQEKMVGWYDPGQLAQTGAQVVVSTLFGENADFRLVEALAANPADTFYDHSVLWRVGSDKTEAPDPQQPRSEIWIDYVGDLGDGWNSTYAVAHQLAQPELTLPDSAGRRHRMPRGDLLIFGGDQVYPTASRSEYARRLVAPYEAALAQTPPPHPHLFAVPGNHDWYDSLVSFTRLFCTGRWFAGWRTQQCRSYFAVKLPRGWWLLGTDVQLGSDVDAPQIEYFTKVAAAMSPGDRIILCNAEPHWIYSATYREYDTEVYNERNLGFLENHVLGRKISVFLAGDLHHYRRHTAADGTQKITSGGGGAFLHPTHGADVSSIPERDDRGAPTGRTFEHRRSWPDRGTSWWLGWRNLAFPWWNPLFGLVPAVLYLLLAWSMRVDLSDAAGLGAILERVATTAVRNPASMFWIVAIMGGFLLFTDTHSRWYRVVAGSLHGLAHLVATLLVGWIATYVSVVCLGLKFDSALQLVVAGVMILAGGWLAGGIIMGLYLLVSLNVFGRHANEAFSSLRIEDWKHFLRLRIDAEGGLTIFPIGLQRVPRRWTPRRAGVAGPDFVPADGRAAPPALIEDPVAVTRRGTGRA